MYFFLILLGMISIAYGLYLEGEKDEEVGLEEFSDVERLYILEEKVNLMEDFLDISQSDYLVDQVERSREEFGQSRQTGDWQLEREGSRLTVGEEIEKTSKKARQNLDRENLEAENLDNIDDKYKLYAEYKSQGHSLEEICKLLNMTKGEVILLENLRRDYRK